MKSNTQNKKIEAITEKTLVIGIDVGSETHYARAFDYRGIEYASVVLNNLFMDNDFFHNVNISSSCYYLPVLIDFSVFA